MPITGNALIRNQGKVQGLSSFLLIVAFFSFAGRSTNAQCDTHEMGNLIPTEPTGGFGRSINIDGDLAIVGAYVDAYLFRFDGSNWIQEANFAGVNAVQEFGYSAAVGGDAAIVGAPGETCPGFSWCGAAYAFRRNANIWGEEQRLTASDVGAFLRFGNSISISGNVAFVGAPGCRSIGPCGFVYIFNYNGSSWVQMARLHPDADESFGQSVSVNGSVAIVGAYRSKGTSSNTPNCGAAYVYRFDGTSWNLEQKLLASDRAADDYFGWSVAVSGDVAVVGARGDDCANLPNTWCGAAYVFRLHGTWIQEAKITASDAPASGFGTSVSCSGNVAVIGAPDDNCAAGNSCGSAYVYRYNGETWIEQTKLSAANGHSNDFFGQSVFANADEAVVGAYQADCPGHPNCGSAYVFELENLPLPLDCNANGVADECDPDCNKNQVPDDCDITSGTSADCNDNNVPDECDTDCNVNQVPDDCDITGGSSADCNGNNIPDECDSQADCNGNSMQDTCDIATGTSGDCNLNGVPDECESPADCNNNGIQDFCDLAGGTSTDCNHDIIPDECQLASNDCNENAIPDDCESPVDCNGNGIRDFCDVTTGTSEDCNSNVVLDECDIASGTSTDANNNGVPDECDTDLPPFIIQEPLDVGACEPETVVFKVVAGGMTPFTYQWRKDAVELGGEISGTLTLSGFTVADLGDYDVVVTNDLGSVTSEQATLVLATLDPISPDPTGIAKVRFISMSIPGGGQAAVRVTFTSMHHVSPPYSSGPTIPFTAFEGQVRWVGPPVQYRESTSDATTFMTASLQCQPYYQDWGTVGLLHVTGSGIVPSSTYDVRALDISCQGSEENCLVVSCSTQIKTSRWGDVASPFNPPGTTVQPNFGDVAALIDKFKSVPGALSKVRAFLVGDDAFGSFSTSTMILDFDFSHIAISLDAFKGKNYPHTIQACP